MILPESDDTRKSTDNQEPTDKRTTRIIATLDKFRVRRKQQDLEVRLKHEFVMAWAPVLTDLAFKLYVVLERFAYFGAGPLCHHTNGYVSQRELADVCGTGRRRLAGALSQLIRHRLVQYENADPADRAKAGRKMDIVIDQTARPTPEVLTTFLERRRNGRHADNAVTLPPSGTGSLPPSGTGSLPPSGTGFGPPVEQGTLPPSGTGSIGSYEGSKGEPLNPPSSSSSVSTAKTDDDERGEKQPDLTPIRQQSPYIVDDPWLNQLWREARAAAPDITVDDLARVLACKVQILKGKTVPNPVAYLKTCVLNAIAGEGLGEYRAWFAVASAVSRGQWRP